ncbi:MULTISPECIES: hypothetical protein [Bradyrhizobium]|uniref:Uncharacterized protein n=1 Tax=Bradyrhizobium ottawaense TaxID=931866 RepID=A0A2U8PCA5_9BRAD|nr:MULTISPECIES: hypothetical protein [Bradyrhizobium]GMP03291.1 hypothetical protein TM239_34550 [Bradyrhizobium sp. TM239]AWL95134.1 hypothetical protein CIT37_25495 [Bradyrhizobium ottawaense]MBR0988526.1 hypothetical protein [Bradyrhizobium liaoningense]MBR1365758.1 hypothetical protein [Bradyrhizobium ottawaense]MDA9474249.1 hypothetical protein [Bradyrhizobium sp. CCBAU 65884]
MADRPRDLAERMARRRKIAGKPGQTVRDGYLRETFTLPRAAARERAQAFFARYPKAGYMSVVESWRELPGGDIEFTMRRLPSAD